MSDTPITPALTTDEWAKFPNIARTTVNEPNDEQLADLPLYHHTKHGIAAANLHGQPFGFTRDDVALLRACADTDVGSDITLSDEQCTALRQLADRINALVNP